MRIKIDSCLSKKPLQDQTGRVLSFQAVMYAVEEDTDGLHMVSDINATEIIIAPDHDPESRVEVILPFTFNQIRAMKKASERRGSVVDFTKGNWKNMYKKLDAASCAGVWSRGRVDWSGGDAAERKAEHDKTVKNVADVLDISSEIVEASKMEGDSLPQIFALAVKARERASTYDLYTASVGSAAIFLSIFVMSASFVTGLCLLAAAATGMAIGMENGSRSWHQIKYLKTLFGRAAKRNGYAGEVPEYHPRGSVFGDILKHQPTRADWFSPGRIGKDLRAFVKELV